MVAFYVDFDSYTDNNNISDGGIINFDNILINEGGGYDNDTDYFTAPAAGQCTGKAGWWRGGRHWRGNEMNGWVGNVIP